ncbi:vacuolar protein sorting-associated protein 1 [Nematocida ausubeli]|nr:vacuolar protein sorting-associated protein 1 [Nematocida ausubeli]
MGLIERVNRLHELCTHIQNPINIPQIVVVGSQSAGKSSILENIVGHQILPRGTGMVTRRPLIIQIIPSQEDAYCSFGHHPGKTFTPSEIEAEITHETDRLLPNKTDVSAIPILLRIYSRNALPLTLIDLPGIIKVQTKNQPDGIIEKIHEIVKSYVTNANTIILAVTPSTTDISSSDALMIAREADPDYTRTLCVLTKVDLMDPGTDLRQILQGKIIPLKLGYVPVICRGEKDIQAMVDIPHAIRKEKEYFSAHPAYSANSAYCGVPYLMTRLHEVLQERIRKSAPYLQDRISYIIAQVSQELDGLGANSNESNEQIIIQAITAFNQAIDLRISGYNRSNNISKEILNGAKISYAVDVLFPEIIEKVPMFTASDQEIRNILHNMSGVFGVNGVPILRHFMHLAGDKIYPHCISMCSKICMEMQGIAEEALEEVPALRRFAALKEEISRVAMGVLKERVRSASDLIKAYIKWNTVYIREGSACHGNDGCAGSSCHSSGLVSVQGSDKLEATDVSCKKKDHTSASSYTCIDTLRHRITKYLDSFKMGVIEQVPKIIIMEVVQSTMDLLQSKLIQSLCTKANMKDLLKEDEKMQERRKVLKIKLEALQEAREISNQL